jgi:tetratricopeptide (TPR) repeat protein
MAHTPADRYAAAEDVATDVRRWLADEPVQAYREPWPARVARWSRRHRTPVIAAGVLLLTATVASSIAAGLVWREQRHTKAEQINTVKNATAAIDVVRKLSTYVESYEMSSGSTAATERERKDRLDAALASYERVLDLHPEDEVLRWNVARMHRMRANLSRFLEKIDDAEQSYNEAIRLFGQLAADFPRETKYRETSALTLRDFGLFLHRIGRRQDAAKMVDEFITVCEDLQRAAPDEPNFKRHLAHMLMNRSDWGLLEGRLAESEQSARRSLDLFAMLAALPGTTADPLDPLFHAMVEHNLAMTLRERGRLEEALAAHDRAVERIAGLTKKLPNNRNALSFYHRARTERAWTAGRMPGRAADAIAELESAVQGWDALIKQMGEVPVDVQRKGVASYYCGRLKANAGRHDAAAKDLAAAAKIQEAFVNQQPQMPDDRYDLGRTYAALGQLAPDSQEAAAWYRKAREMLDAAVQRYPENVLYRNALAEVVALATGKS